MSSPDPDAEARRIAARAGDHDPTGWFEQLYAAARSGDAVVPWDRGGPNPRLVDWTSSGPIDGSGRSALVVGAGLGADAEHLASLGFATTAFDVAPTAVASARDRHPGSPVAYTTADLLDLPATWQRSFDLVLESLTVQSLPVALHARAIEAVVSLVAPGGTLLVLATRVDDGDVVDGPPWPLTPGEINLFSAGDLDLVRLEELDDPADPSIRRWRVELRRPL